MTEDRARLDTLPSRYPHLFPKGPLCYGFEIGAGWTLLIDILFERIDTILNEVPNAKMEVLQVKEKFGRLRFYYSVKGANSAIESELQEAVQAVEMASARCCERCGAPGRLNDKGWLRTRCSRCRKH